MAFTASQRTTIMSWLGIPFRSDKITNAIEQLALVAASAEAEISIEVLLAKLAIIEADQEKVRTVPHIPSYSLNTVELDRLTQQLSILTGLAIETRVWNPQGLVPLIPLSSPAIRPLITLPLFTAYTTERGLQISPNPVTVKSFKGDVRTAVVRVLNNSIDNITVTNILLAGEGTLALTGLPSLPLTLAANATTSFNVSFDPPDTAAIVYAANGELTIADSTGKTYTIPVTGTVINATP